MSSYSGGVKNRRKRALEKLEAQLKSGQKPYQYQKGDPKSYLGTFVLLTDKDKERISKEISTLKTRI